MKTEFSTQRHRETEGEALILNGRDAINRVSTESVASSFSEPEGKIYLLYGDQLVFRLSHYIAARTMLDGQNSPPLQGGAWGMGSIAVIDGCNRFDVHYLSRFACQRKIDPNQFLRKVFVSRGFTCYQMESAVGGKLPAFLKRIGSRTAFIFGLLDTFYDQQAPYREVRQIFERLLIKFHQMKTDGISLLLTSMDWKVIPEERNQLFDKLKKNADKVFHLTLSEEGRPKLFLESVSIPVCTLNPKPLINTNYHEFRDGFLLSQE